MSGKAETKLFYDILSISKDASQDEIKKAYKRLAIKWHPDKNLSNQQEASEMFKLVSEAYEVLSDPARRRDYDLQQQYGNAGDRERRSRDRGDRGGREYYEELNPEYSFRRAQDIFDSFFAEFDNDPFFSHFSSGIRSNRHRFHEQQQQQQPQRHPFADPFFGGARMGMDAFSDPFFSNMGMGFGGMSSSFESNFASNGSVHRGGNSFGGASRSMSTTTIIGPDGRKRVKTEVTVVNADGSRETSVEETVDGLPLSSSSRAIGNDRYQGQSTGALSDYSEHRGGRSGGGGGNIRILRGSNNNHDARKY